MTGTAPLIELEAVEAAFFNHDSDGSEGPESAWEARRLEWASFKKYLLNYTPNQPEAVQQNAQNIYDRAKKYQDENNPADLTS